MLQIAFKAINNITSPNGLILTLFIFNAYSCIVINLLFSLLEEQQAHTLTKKMSKLCKLKAPWRINDIFNT